MSPYGRVRHFHFSEDEKVMAAQQREASNFPIQGTVADALTTALGHLERERNRLDMKFRIVLAVHDAIFIEVPYEEVPEAKALLEKCMSEMTEVPGIGLRYGVDVEVFQRWNEELEDESVLKACGLL